VVNSAGNEGNDSWKVIGTPADADSVLSIGGIQPKGRYHTAFSSFGPTSDKRMKPNVTAFGHVIASGPKGFDQTQGTSFSGPLVAGFAACAWQTNRDLKNMELFKEIERSGNLYPYFDYAHGFGIPQAIYFTGPEPEKLPTFDFERTESALKVIIRPEFYPQDTAVFSAKDLKAEPANVAARFVAQPDNEKFSTDYVYYHIENQRGYLDKYYVVEVNQPEVLNLNLADIGAGKTVRVHYKNYTQTFKLD
jgi:serine protease AprX